MATRKKTPPVVPDADKAAIAPYPLVDRSPTVLGSNVSMQTVSSAFRSCQNGYRQPFVDLLDELIERDPHAHAVISQRILATAGGRLEITPAKCDAGSDDEKLAQQIAKDVERRLESIPSFTEVLAGLLWALYYGVAAAEISWSIDECGWYPARIHFVHTRRLSYPDPKTWDLHIWDQGLVRWGDGSAYAAVTSKTLGTAVADYPGKFIVHSPQLRGDYPTRDGLGREIGYWMVLKGIAARGAGQYLERFGKPWVTATFKTGGAGQEFGRSASQEDIDTANVAAAALGLGSVASAVLPDSITMKIDHPAGGITQAEFISICDQQMSKAVLGQTMTTEVGAHGGNRALGQVQKEGSKELSRYDATCLAESLKRDLVSWIVRLNYPEAQRLTPNVAIHVGEKPDPLQAMQVAQLAVASGMPIDADDLAQRLGLKLVDPKDPNARRLFPIAAQKDPAQFDADLAERAAAIAVAFPAPEPETPDTNDVTDDATPDEDVEDTADVAPPN